jgi:hypothetical protein
VGECEVHEDEDTALFQRRADKPVETKINKNQEMPFSGYMENNLHISISAYQFED